MAKSFYDFCIEKEAFELLVQWDKENNGGLTPMDVSYGSHKKIWWKCKQNHSWEAAVYSRTGIGSSCPYCKGKKISTGSDSLEAKFPELAKEWNYDRNDGLLPGAVLPSTHRKVWWKCSNGHEWQAQVNIRTRGSSCPVCSNKKIIEGVNDLATLYPDIAAQWHPIRNGARTPQSVVPGNHSKAWWKCEKGHEWQATILSRTTIGSSCPVCAGKIVIPGINDFASAKPQLAKQWHPTKNGPLRPQNVTPFSNKTVWWICDKGHEYRAIVGRRSQLESDCPYCKNCKVLIGFNDLATVEPKIAAQWHPELNGTLTPQMATAGSRKKVWWLCTEGHVWKAVIYSRAGVQKSGCPVCSGRIKESKMRHSADIADDENL